MNQSDILLGGSSPLTRGKRNGGHPSMQAWRLIPAHAGKTSSTASRRRCRKAHPRSRGENASDATNKFADTGSSPLTRGKRVEGGAHLVDVRLIPAHAGKTPWASGSRWPWAAHPRSRGENLTGRQGLGKSWGSSPLTRGKRADELHPVDLVRLIPAHAGKTSLPHRRRISHEAHPRSRGENWIPPRRRSRPSGSSPLTRGKLSEQRPHERLFGAHPRSRGENAVSGDRATPGRGSSPLTRGKRGARDDRPDDRRLIPAHAGKTRRSGWR